MTNLLTWNYWFNLQPEALLPWAERLFIGTIIFLAVSALIIVLIRNRGGVYHGFLNSLYSFFLVNALIGLLFFFFNYESTSFVSARFWLGLWGIGMLVWLFFIFKKFKTVSAYKMKLTQEQARKKYLP